MDEMDALGLIDENEDRRVFVKLPSGAEVVRYARAGRWYIEQSGYPSALLLVSDAARWTLTEGALVYPDQPGGRVFRAEAIRLRREVGVDACARAWLRKQNG